MSGSTISGTITHTVRLGSAGALSPLTITSTGDIAPSAYGANGVFVPASLQGGTITNNGQISGTYGGYELGAGGIGIEARAAVSVSNTGSIVGGYGSDGTTNGFHGGTGVDLSAGGSLMNRGSILGGHGGHDQSANSQGGSGGKGVQIHDGALRNTGTIAGGTGGSAAGGPNMKGGVGGIGVDLTGSTATNSGVITGGYSGETYSFYKQLGGIGVRLDGGNMSNTGTIMGGYGPHGYYVPGNGGVGVDLSNGAVMTNAGLIEGGNGGNSQDQSGGYGGVGVLLEHAMLTNTGTIAGGLIGVGYTGGGGVGATIVGGTLVTSGTIAGAAYGGVGVNLDGGTLVTSGLVAGGSLRTSVADSVVFGSQAGTIVIETGAIFRGAISGFGAGDVLDSTTKVTSLTFISGTLTLEHNGRAFETLSLTGTFTAANFHLTADGHGGTDITYGMAGRALPDFAPGMLDAGSGGVSREHASPPAWHFGDHDAGSPIAVFVSHAHAVG